MSLAFAMPGAMAAAPGATEAFAVVGRGGSQPTALGPPAQLGAAARELRGAGAPRASTAAAGSEGWCRSAAGAAASLLLLSRAAQRRQRRRAGRVQCRAAADAATSNSRTVTEEVLKLTKLGTNAFDKALDVNLDASLYGSFAEIGAGQEVSRTFLTAGAAAGTVARSLSAYDMRLSDVTYGKAKRYVTQERLRQMLVKEYMVLEENIRETKGPDTRFFSFATTLAARAYMSNRECEGWVGFSFQHEPGAEPSTVVLHCRMRDETAQEQGEAIGLLGTNLIYLCNSVHDPYLIASFLQDGIAPKRLEIDYVNFEGPNWPEGTVDPRLLAMRMVQFRVAVSVMLDYDESTGRYVQAVPNSALYKQSLVVQRSRFRPVTYAHREVMEAASKQLQADLGAEAKPPMKILNLQIDDIVRPLGLVRTEGRVDRARKLAEADTNADGKLSVAELRTLASERLSPEKVDELIKEVDVQMEGFVAIDSLLGLSRESILVTEFLDRFNMIEPLQSPVLVSGIRRNHSLAQYLNRYTQGDIAITIGGGNYDIARGLFNPEAYEDDEGGMLEAFGRLFSKNVRIFQYPNISLDGNVCPLALDEGSSAADLHKYLVKEGKIVLIDSQHISPEVMDKTTNVPFRGQSSDVMQLIQESSDDWKKYVPDEVVEIVEQRSWFSRVSTGRGMAKSVYAILNEL